MLASQWLKAQASQGTGRTTEIFVATVPIDIGESITPEKIRLEQWPTDKVPPGSCGDLSELENKYARQRFYAGETIMPVKLMDENWTTVPRGYRVVAMKAADASIANLVQPGDRVDVMAYFNKSDMVPQSMTKTILLGVRVYALDGDTERRAGEDRAKNLKNIQLLIHEKDAEAWTYANELGRIRLSLGSDADYSNEDGSNEAGQEFLAWLDDHRQAQADALKSKQRQPGSTTDAGGSHTEEEGVSMLKIVEGRMMEYRIVPGKLPVLVGEVGEGAGSSSGGVSTVRESMFDSASNDDDAPVRVESEYDYLNGSDSPLFLPPTTEPTESVSL